jgi:integrase
MACRNSIHIAEVRETAQDQNSPVSSICTSTVLNSVPAIPIRRRGKCMSRRIGQNGEVFVKQLCKKGGCTHPKGLCPKYGRYWKDVPGQHERQRLSVSFGKVSWTVAERKLREHIIATGVDSVETFNEVTGPLTTFREQAIWWRREIRAGRILSKKKRTPMRSATIAGYESAVTWLTNIIGDKPLTDVKNEVARELVTAMKSAKPPLADKTIVSYFQVVKAVVASAVNKEGEQLHSRNWNLHHIGLPIVNERKQSKPAYVATEVEQIVSTAKGRYRVLFALLAGSGLRAGEALGLRVGEHVSPDCKTLYVRQSVWNGKEQDPKTENAVRDVDLCSDLAVMLKAFIGNRTNGFLFHADSSKPLLQRNVLRDGLNPILAKLNLKQDGKAFHSFRRFRVMHLRKSRVPWDLEKFWIGHANKDVTDKYAAQLKEDVEWRKDVAEKTGLGFALPASSEISIGQLGQPEMIGSEEAKAA